MESRISQSTVKWSVLVLLLVVVPLFQVSSLWNYTGDKVDESEIYMYAVGFFGGNYNPHWYGYGNLPMYVLHGMYLFLYPFAHFAGTVDSLVEYCQQVFYNGFFVLVARYVFAIIGVATILLYAKSGRENGMSWLMVGLFLLVGFLGRDALTFANYIRCDVFVGFFCAVAFYCALKCDQRKYLYLLAIAVAGCIASKKSALPMVAYLAAFTGYQWWRGTASWRDVGGVGLLFVVASIMFQPYVNWAEQITSLLAIGSEGVRFSFSKQQYASVDARVFAIGEVLTTYCSPYVLALVPLSLFAWRKPRLLFAAYFLLFLLLAPYVVSNEITYYWFAPVFPLIKFLAMFGVSAATTRLAALLRRPQNGLALRTASMLVALLVPTYVLYFVAWPNAQSLVKSYAAGSTNYLNAQKWLHENITSQDVVLFEAHNSFMVPKLYDADRLLESRMLSRAFLYNREQNKFLQEIFAQYLRSYYIERYGKFNVRSIHVSRAKMLQEVVEGQFANAYYVVSPSAVKPFRISSSNTNLSSPQQELKERYKSYFEKMMSGQRVAEFSSGSSHPVEIYRMVSHGDRLAGTDALFTRVGRDRWLYRHDPQAEQRLWIQSFDRSTRAGEEVEASLILASDQRMVVSASLARHDTSEPYEGSAKTVTLEPDRQVEVNLSHRFKQARSKLKIQLDVRECGAPAAHLTIKNLQLRGADAAPELSAPVDGRRSEPR
jgi:hypothetical protein